MKSLLFLCHRLPYPPDKGDKIRSFHVLKALTQHFKVHVGTFVDTPEDWAHLESLRAMVTELHVLPLSKRAATMRSVSGLLSGEALTIPFYRDAAMLRWVRDLLDRTCVSCAYVYSSGMGQYIEKSTGGHRPELTIMDFCDLDSDKWAQYAKSRRWPLSWLYRREAKRLAATELQLARHFDRSLFVSKLESEMFQASAPDLAERVLTLGNGVNTGYFDPQLPVAPHAPNGSSVVFTGAMDYWANVEAVSWFVDEVWPSVIGRLPAAHFYIVGSRPAEAVLRLDGKLNVSVTGTVPDVRPYLAGARVVVAPLRIARGVQNKVLEAMAMARPVVATGAALQGLEAPTSGSLRRCDTGPDFASAIVDFLLDEQAVQKAQVNRGYVLREYSWSAALRPLWALLSERQLLEAGSERAAASSQEKASANR